MSKKKLCPVMSHRVSSPQAQPGHWTVVRGSPEIYCVGSECAAWYSRGRPEYGEINADDTWGRCGMTNGSDYYDDPARTTDENDE